MSLHLLNHCQITLTSTVSYKINSEFHLCISSSPCSFSPWLQSRNSRTNTSACCTMVFKTANATNQHVCTKFYTGRGGCLVLLVLACHQSVLSAKQQCLSTPISSFALSITYLQALDHTGSAIVKHNYWHRNCTALKGMHNTTSEWQMPTRAHKSKIGCPLGLRSQHLVSNHQWNCILQIKLKPVQSKPCITL